MIRTDEEDVLEAAFRKQKELAEKRPATPHLREVANNLQLADLAANRRHRRQYLSNARLAAERAARTLQSAAFSVSAEEWNIVGRGFLVPTRLMSPHPTEACRFFRLGTDMRTFNLPHVRAQLSLGIGEAEFLLGRIDEARGKLFGALSFNGAVQRFKDTRGERGPDGLTPEERKAHVLFTDVLSRASVLAHNLDMSGPAGELYSEARAWAGDPIAGSPTLGALVEQRWNRLHAPPRRRFFWWR